MNPETVDSEILESPSIIAELVKWIVLTLSDSEVYRQHYLPLLVIIPPLHNALTLIWRRNKRKIIQHSKHIFSIYKCSGTVPKETEQRWQLPVTWLCSGHICSLTQLGGLGNLNAICPGLSLVAGFSKVVNISQSRQNSALSQLIWWLQSLKCQCIFKLWEKILYM